MTEKITFAPVFPLPLLLVLTLVGCGFLAYACRGLRSRSALFVVIALWLRMVFDAWPQITIHPLVAGLSLNAMLSIGTALVGLALIDRRHLLNVWLLPAYLMIAAILVSHAFNGDVMAMVDPVMKMIYMVVLMVATAEGLRFDGVGRLSSALLRMLGFLFVLEGAAVAFGLAKYTSTDNSTAYAGGFNHESNFALALALVIVPLIAAERLGAKAKIAILGLLTCGLMAANYRTVILGLLPIMLYLFVREALSFFVPKNRSVLIFGAVAAIGAAVLLTPSLNLGDRWGALGDLVSNPGIMQEPESFTREEQRKVSGRAYLFSFYFHEFERSDTLHQMVGHGSESWKNVIRVYAQNTLLSYLYEFGILGVLAALSVWGALFLLGLRIRSDLIVPFFLLNVGLVAINMSTMPMTLIEGIALYGLTGGYLLHFAAEQATRRRGGHRVPRDGRGSFRRPRNRYLRAG